MAVKRKPRGLTVVMKPTHNCNLSCGYCYIEENAEKGEMNEDTLTNSIIKVSEFVGKNARIHFLWHGGEPLLVGKRFFRKVVNIQSKLGEDYRITNAVQSNGTLLDSDMADFFQDNNFKIGFSLDGPPDLHNITRPFKNGSNSHKDVIRGMVFARERDIGGRGAIIVLNKISLEKLEDIYVFFRDNRIGMKVNPLIHAGEGRKHADELNISPTQYGKAMVALFDLWFYDKSHGDGVKIQIDPFDKIIKSMFTGNTYSCRYANSCREGFISIGPEGDVYPCGRFDGNKDFHIGNINEDTFEALYYSLVQEAIRKRYVESCKPCEYKSLCNSGCAHNSYSVNQDISEKDPYCAGYKMVFSHVKNAIIELAKGGERNGNIGRIHD